MDWIVKKVKFTSTFEMFFSCFGPFGVWIVTKPRTTKQMMWHLGSKDKFTEGSIQSQDPCRVDKDKAPTELLRKDSREHKMVQRSLLKLLNQSTVTSALMRVTYLAQTHLLSMTGLNNANSPKSLHSSWWVWKEEFDRIEISPVAQGQHILGLKVEQI